MIRACSRSYKSHFIRGVASLLGQLSACNKCWWHLITQAAGREWGRVDRVYAKKKKKQSQANFIEFFFFFSFIIMYLIFETFAARCYYILIICFMACTYCMYSVHAEVSIRC